MNHGMNIIDEKLGKMRGRIKTKMQLKKVITQIWRSITPEQCEKLLLAVPGRLKAIRDKDGERLLGRRTDKH